MSNTNPTPTPPIDPAMEQARGDRRTKQFVIGTLCALAGATVLTLCIQALRGQTITIEVKDVALTIVGVLSGMLIRTGVDPSPIKGTEAEPVVVKAPANEPVKTQEVNEAPKANPPLPTFFPEPSTGPDDNAEPFDPSVDTGEEPENPNIEVIEDADNRS